MFDPTKYKWPTPKRLVLSLLSSADLKEISARDCVHWATLFAIDPTAMRVALGRLVKSGFLRSVDRGRYAIGDRGKVLSETARRWVAAEGRVEPWDGRWLMVHTAHLGRRDQAAVKLRERALQLVGFAELRTGLWCRPANYREPASKTREQLEELGLEKDAILLRADALHCDRSEFEKLWPRAALEARYENLTQAMVESMRRGNSGDTPTDCFKSPLKSSPNSKDSLARETFLLGEAVIRQVNSDPLLPNAMVDVAARRKMHETMVAYEAFGRAAWARFQNHCSQ